jgi:hypothetical protein
MIVVRVELHSARTGQTSELARMEICNDESGIGSSGGTISPACLRGRSKEALDRRVVQRQGTLKDWPSEAVHVWNLVAVLLGRMGYGARSMKAISLWQPWASLWCSPRKIHETRHWPTNNRGWMLVHAAQAVREGLR